MLMTLRKVLPSSKAAMRQCISLVIGGPPLSQLLPIPELTVNGAVHCAVVSRFCKPAPTWKD